MKRKLYSFALAGLMMLAGQAAWADLQQNENGAYLIGSKQDLQAWSEMAGYESTDVLLTGDIEEPSTAVGTPLLSTMTSRASRPACSTTSPAQ